MDRISRQQMPERLQFCDLWTNSLFFADVALLVSSDTDLLITLIRSTAKQDWELAPPSLRSWFPAGKGRFAYSRIREQRSRRMTYGLAQHWQGWGWCTNLLWWKESQVWKRSYWLTTWFTFPPSPTSYWNWLPLEVAHFGLASLLSRIGSSSKSKYFTRRPPW